MTVEAKITVRKPRADAERNRQRLLDAAKRVLADKGISFSLDEVSRAAKVGIGTLYRHFPTREALIEQVYRHETEQLAGAANRLAAEQPPVEALQAWMHLFVEYFVTKQIVSGALSAMVCGTAALYAGSAVQIGGAIDMLTARAIASGDIRLTVEPTDLLRAVCGVANLSPDVDWKENAGRMVDILIAGIRTTQPDA